MIGYASRVLTKAEANYSTTEREALAVIYGITYFRQYLHGQRFTVQTDHGALCYLINLKNPSGRLMRWSLLLQDFDFTICYKSGKRHTDVDSLSRMPHAGTFVVTRSRSQAAAASACRLSSGGLATADHTSRPESSSSHRDTHVKDLARQAQQLQQNQREKTEHQQQQHRSRAVAKSTDSGTRDALQQSHRLPHQRPASLPLMPDSPAFDLRSAQRQDPDFRAVIETLSSSSRVPLILSRRFRLHDGLLFNTCSLPSRDLLRLCVPTICRPLILHLLHDDVICGHLGTRRTWLKVRERFYWPTMYRDTRDYVLSCESCAAVKTPRRLPAGLLQPLDPPSYPFERIGIDTLGPLPLSRHRNTHATVITDYCTKTVIAQAVPANTAACAAKVLVHQVILRYGCPRVILSDRGSEFCNSVIASLTQHLRITHSRSTAYHARTNGQTERINHTFAQMLTHYVNQQQTDWDELLPFLCFAYNSSVHQITGYSPFYLLHGFVPRLPVDQLFPSPPATDTLAYEHLRRLQAARQIARVRLLENREAMRARFDLKRRPNDFRVGDQVWIWSVHHVPGRARKLEPHFRGPFLLVRQTAANDFETIDANGKRDVVNVERMKLHHARPAHLSLPESPVARLPCISAPSLPSLPEPQLTEQPLPAGDALITPPASFDPLADPVSLSVAQPLRRSARIQGVQRRD